jgi:hypothetical protein
MVQRVEHTGRFTAVDANGTQHIVEAFTDIISAATLTNPNAETRGQQWYETTSGQAVHRLAKGKYQVVETGLLLESDDASAP